MLRARAIQMQPAVEPDALTRLAKIAVDNSLAVTWPPHHCAR
jgi:hypothetical protein